MSNLRDKFRSIFEVLLTALLFSTQTILNAGVFISVMIIPLLSYLFVLPSYLNMNQGVMEFEIWLTFFSNNFIVGQIILYVGLLIFIVAALQWIWYHYKNIGLFRKGLYSRIRHPQFTGIIIITLGLTIIVLTMGNLSLSGPFLSRSYLSLAQIVGLWFLQVLGYIAIAQFEERHYLRNLANTKNTKNEYRSYSP